MKIKTCPRCGKKFDGTDPRRVWCSRRCKNAAHEAKVRAFYRQFRQLRESA